MSTHLGQPPENHVVLESLIFPEGWVEWERNFPDGTRGYTHGGYRVPVGMMLVITDVDWHYESSEPGSTQTFRLFLLAKRRESWKVYSQRTSPSYSSRRWLPGRLVPAERA